MPYVRGVPYIVLMLAAELVSLSAQRPIDLRQRGFRTGAELVTTAVTVRDANGRLITTLQQRDFTVEEDGKEQPITQFTKERVPVSLSLVLDTSDSMRGQKMIDARAAILLVSDGADTASDISPTRLKQTLVRSDVFLYAIAIDSGDERSSTRVNPYTLGELSAQGGGYSEVIRTAADLGPATERIAEELNHQYMIGYAPTTVADGQYHSVRVKVNNPEYKVRARRGVVR